MFRLLLRLHPHEQPAAATVIGASDNAAAPAPAVATSDPMMPVEDPDWTHRTRVRAEMHLFRIERGAPTTVASAAESKSKVAAAVNRNSDVDSRAATPVQDNDSATATVNPNPTAAATTAAASASVPVSPLPQPTDSRQLLVVAVPHLLSSSHLLQELAGLGFSTLSSATRIICPRTGQHSLLLRFHTSADADTFFQRIHNHPFHALRREVAYVFQLAEGAVEERVISPAESLAPVAAAAGSLELPCCPRCLSKLDSSLTEIVSELEDCSLVRVRSSRTNQWRTHRVPIWPEIRCETCSAVAAQSSVNPASQADARTACRACIAAPASAAAADGCASASPLDSAQSLSRSTSTVHSNDNSLWICLLCSHIGCGRYASSGAAHAFAHYLATQHNWAMETQMGAIWDYRNDGYIHRVHGAAATAASAAAAAAAASIAESAARSHASRARKTGTSGDGEHKEDPASSSDESDAEQQQQLLHWSRWNEMPAVPVAASSAPTTAAPSTLTRSSSAGFSVTAAGGDDAAGSSSDAELHALSLSAAASTPDDDVPSYGLDSEEASALLHSKLESIASFYNHLLTHTLQTQYEFFTQRIADCKADEEQQHQCWEPQIAAQTARDREAAARISQEVDTLDQSNRALDRSVRDLAAKVSKLTEENSFVKDLNTRMLQDQMAQRKATAAAQAQAQAQAQAAATASPVKSGTTASSPSTPAAATASAAASPSPAPSTPSSVGSSSTAASALSSPPPPSTPVSAAASAAASASPAAASSPSPAASSSSAAADLHLQLDPSLVSKYAQLRDQKARRTAALEKEVARLMEAIEAKSKKEAAAAAAKEAARKERVKRSMVGGIGAGAGGSGGANSSASSRGRRG